MILKGSSQRELRRLVTKALKGREIEDLLVQVESTEGEPSNGYKTQNPTGRQFVHITTVAK